MYECSSSMSKLNSAKGVWDDMRPRDLWDYGTSASAGNAVPGSRPPPGLPKKTGGPSTPVPTASGIVTSGTNSNSFNSYRNNTTSWGGNQGSGMSHLWLLLRNLTPQIDGSTLKTLCLQHGPLQNFHLYLSHGVALVRYSSREEAAKVGPVGHSLHLISWWSLLWACLMIVFIFTGSACSE